MASSPQQPDLIPRTLAIGHSHFNRKRQAIPQGLKQRVEVVDVLVDSDKYKPETKTLPHEALTVRDPEIPAFALSGQGHNILGLVEHPTPFAVVADGWQEPGEQSREIIPSTTLLAALAERMAEMQKTTASIMQMFPDAVVAIINPPPPLADKEAIPANPPADPKKYAESTDRGLAPDGLRVAVHAVQTEIHRDVARRLGAHFLAAPPESLTPEGLLAIPFCGQDPSHANAGFGRVMLNLILDIKSSAQWPIPPEDTPIKDFPIDSSGVPTPA